MHSVIELDTVAEFRVAATATTAPMRSRINPAVIWDENREIINATSPSKFPLPCRIGGKSDRETHPAPIVTLTNFTRRRRVPDSAIKRFEMCIEDVVYMKLRSASPPIQRDPKSSLVCVCTCVYHVSEIYLITSGFAM